jgi:hypothetical protein
MISSLPKKKKHHLYITEFLKYFKAHKDEINLTLIDVEPIAIRFKLILHNLDLKRYTPSDYMETIKECIENNSSYIYSKHNQDIRTLLNNLPDRKRLSEKAQYNYNDFILESIRKNIMFHQFNIEREKLKPRLPPH